VNAALASGVSRHPGRAVLVDWDAAAASRPDLLWADGIHPRPAGGALYAQALAAALAGGPVSGRATS
jgi:hypothetical protein